MDGITLGSQILHTWTTGRSEVPQINRRFSVTNDFWISRYDLLSKLLMLDLAGMLPNARMLDGPRQSQTQSWTRTSWRKSYQARSL